MVRHILCDFKWKLNSATCNSNQKNSDYKKTKI